MSFIDPEQTAKDAEVKEWQVKLEASAKEASDKADTLAAEFGAQPDPAVLLGLRITYLLDWLIPQHVDADGYRRDDMDAEKWPTNVERLIYEHGWNMEVINLVDEIRDQIDEALAKQRQREITALSPADIEKVMRSKTN
jgi:hypothetical protein